MFHVTGRISGKKPMKTGVTANGGWKILVFSITKRIHKKQEHFWFTAKGKKADLIQKLRINDKIDIEFIPTHRINGDNIFTENIIIDVELSAKLPSWNDTNEEAEPEVEFVDDMNLQADVDKKSKQYNGTT